MSSDEAAIRVHSLSKCYELYSAPRDRLKQFILPRLQKLGGRVAKRYYREFWALNDVDFRVQRGETVGIVGRNGSGKSTLLQIICGTLSPTNGTIETSGRIAALLELGSGFSPDFTGRENAYLNGALLGLEKEEIDECFDKIVDFADIGDFIDQPVKMYSSGMVVRLAFAVAIHSSPKILVVDEALAVGDELFQRKCFSQIERIKQDGATILFVSHSGSTIIDLCDRAILLDSGEVLTEGHPKAVIGQYQRLMYAPADKAKRIRDRIRDGKMDGPESDTDHGQNTLESSNGFYDPSLIPRSTIVYETRGALIESARITNASGERVNCLESGKHYRYVFDVWFKSGATSVLFGMLIKTVSGTELGGGVTSPSLQEALPYVEPNARLTVSFDFVCSLNPGVYFVNAGVLGSEGDEQIFLHRLLDACMFRVLPSPGNLSSGVVDFSCRPQIVDVGGEKVQ